jgi:chromosome segregation ATPase
MPSIQRIKELEAERDEAKKLNEQYDTSIIGLTKELNDARREAARLERDGIEIHAMWKDTASRLLLCQNKLDKLQKKKDPPISQS